MMNINRNHRENQRGVALITALGLLALFMTLGAIWFVEMTNDNTKTDFAVSRTRTQLFANAGVYARLADLSEAVGSSADSLPLGEQVLEFPVYAQGVTGNTLTESEDYWSRTTVTVTDENARININHAPPKVLRRLLGVEGSVARAIRAGLPVDDAQRTDKQRWLTSVDELVTRGFMTAAQLNDVDPGLITVYTGTDASNATRFINVNSAPAPVIQAVLDLQPEQADRVIAARPFYNVNELTAAAGKEATLFNTRPPESSNNGLPPELTFKSTCFRIVADAELMRRIRDGESASVGRARTEAVVQFDDGGRPHVQFWSEAPKR